MGGGDGENLNGKWGEIPSRDCLNTKNLPPRTRRTCGHLQLMLALQRNSLRLPQCPGGTPDEFCPCTRIHLCK